MKEILVIDLWNFSINRFYYVSVNEKKLNGLIPFSLLF